MVVASEDEDRDRRVDRADGVEDGAPLAVGLLLDRHVPDFIAELRVSHHYHSEKGRARTKEEERRLLRDRVLKPGLLDHLLRRLNIDARSMG